MSQQHLKPNSKISAYLCHGKSMHNDLYWKTKYIDNPNWNYKEEIMDILDKFFIFLFTATSPSPNSRSVYSIF